MTNPQEPRDREERARLDALRRYDILDTAPEEAFDRVTRLAARALDADLAFLCFVDEARRWIKSRAGIGVAETPRGRTICNRSIQQADVLIVPNAPEDERFRDDPLVTQAPYIRFYAAAPLTTPDGHRLGALCVADSRPRPRPDERLAGTLADLAATAMSELELRLEVRRKEAVERELRAIGDALPVQISVVDKDLTYQFINQRYNDWYGRTDILGRRLQDVIGQASFQVAMPNLQRALRGDAVTYENKVRRRDGAVRHVLVSLMPKQSDGHVEGVYLAAVDISQQKETEERLRLLNAEFDHRLKNALATVLALIEPTARNTETKAELAAALGERIGAMSRAYDVIHAAQDGGIDVHTVFRTQLAPFAEGRDGRLTFHGPDVTLKANAGLAIAIGVHELVVNSAKYGALSVPEGSVAVDWRLEGDGQPRLVLNWKESGGPRVSQPRGLGFGAAAIEQLLPYDVGARSQLDFETDGVRWCLQAPLMRVVAEAGEYASREASPPAVLHDQQASPRGLAGVHILIAEDSAHIAFSLETSLRAEGAEVVGPVATVEEARRLAESRPIDIAIVDINLNDELSFPLIDELQDRGIEVIASTGYDLERQFPDRMSVLPVLKKPFTTQQLLKMLKRSPAARQG